MPRMLPSKMAVSRWQEVIGIGRVAEHPEATVGA